ncbi:MAG: transglycosylase domain-containing protein [Anaerolineae bacterium]|nr:transglycosylase domain-containing protein [Anaerolineae bacterium]MDW8172341.1 transglycosylase domain-containing protein [Anaerolineae bacterium]
MDTSNFPTAQQLWHAPDKTSWTGQDKATPALADVPALPSDLESRPRLPGGWHLPDPKHTVYDAASTVSVPQRQAAPAAVRSVAPAALSPEDLIAEILGQARSSARPISPEPLAPEDMLLLGTPASEDQSTIVVPQPADEEGTVLLPGIGEDETEAFSFSELAALQELERQAAQDQAKEVKLEEDDLSPAAQMALLAKQAEAILPLGAVPQPDPNDPAEVARQRLRELEASTGATRVLTEAPSPVSAALALDEADQQTREQMRQARSAIQMIRQQYDAGQISLEAAEQQQQNYYVWDAKRQTYWQFGINKLRWFKYETTRPGAQWEEADPPFPLDETEPLLGGSLPYYSQPQQQVEVSSSTGQVYGTDGQSAEQTIASPAALVNELDMTYLGSGQGTQQNISVVQDTIPVARLGELGAPGQTTVPSAQPAIPGYGDQPRQTEETPKFDALRERERSSAARAFILVLVGLIACGAIAAVAAIGGATAWYNQQISPWLSAIDALSNYQPDFQTARILDAEGNLIVELSGRGGARQNVSLDRVSPFLIHAIISSQNPTFYDDAGYSLGAVLQSASRALSGGGEVNLKPTITQQVARNLVLKNPSPTAQQSILEGLVAMEIANRYDKNFILQLYLNESFFGNQSYGVEAAARFYFNQPAARVNLAQAAMLAAALRSPAANDPVVNRVQAARAARDVIREMLAVNCLQFQHGARELFCVNENVFVVQDGQNAPLLRVNADGTFGGALAIQLAVVETDSYQPREARGKYQHFVNYVLGIMEATYGAEAIFQRGFTVYTTLIPRMQDESERALRQQISALVSNGVNTGAILITDPTTGAIRAFVGSPDFNNAEVNGQEDYARTWQQSGDIIKPLVYAAALEGGPNGYYTPASVLFDVPSQYTGLGGAVFTPTNVGGRFSGVLPLRNALATINTVTAVKTLEFVGTDKFADLAGRLGLNFLPEEPITVQTAAGFNQVRLIDLMKAYGTLANGGRFTSLHAIERVTENIDGTEVDVVPPQRTPPTAAVSPQIAFLMQNLLSDDQARTGVFPPNSALTLQRLGLPTQGAVATYSGTSPRSDSLWTVGFTNNTVIGVWLGTYDDKPTTNASGFTAAAPLWNRLMEMALTGRNPSPFGNPGGVVQDTVCADSGTLAGGTNCPNRRAEIFIQGQPAPSPQQGFAAQVIIDSWTGFRANNFCPENQVTQTFLNISDPFAIQWINGTPEGRAWAQRVGLPANAQPIPAQECQQGQTFPTIILNAPGPEGQPLSGTVTITGQVTATDFARFDLEFAPANSANFQRIVTNTQQFPTPGSTLATWDTTAVPNGTYTLRLAAYSTRGGFIFRTVNVTLNNVPPTPTPTLEPTLPSVILPTVDPNLGGGGSFLPPTIGPGFTPLPFDPLGPTPTLMP